MTRSAKYEDKKNNVFALIIISLFLISLSALIFLYFYGKSTIVIEAPKENLGKKVIVELPSGKNIYTYENRIREEDGKLIYKGERNTLDLTGGTVVYENWD